MRYYDLVNIPLPTFPAQLYDDKPWGEVNHKITYLVYALRTTRSRSPIGLTDNQLTKMMRMEASRSRYTMSAKTFSGPSLQKCALQRLRYELGTNEDSFNIKLLWII